MTALRFGEISVDTVSDGYLDLDRAGFFPGVSEEEWNSYPTQGRAARDGSPGNVIRCALTTYLVRTAGRVVLVDTGLGPHLGGFRGQCGALLDGLAAQGVSPEQIDTIVFTHLHADHVGWNCTKAGDVYRPTFPKARYLINRVEFERWRPEPAGYLRRHVQPLGEAGQLELVDDGYEPAPGTRLLGTPGHTAGHVSVLVYGGGEGGVITGDALHHPVQVDRPEWSPNADDDRALSARSRVALLDRLEAEGLLLLGGHFPAPHAGRVVRVGPRRTYLPLAV